MTAVAFTPPRDRRRRRRAPRPSRGAQRRGGREAASGQLRDALSGTAGIERILLKAAAGAGKSYVLKQLVADAVDHHGCARASRSIAFQNRQLWPIAASLGETLGKERVCLFVEQGPLRRRARRRPRQRRGRRRRPRRSPATATVVVATSHKLGALGERRRLLDRFGAGANGEAPFDVLFVDEAWQLAAPPVRQGRQGSRRSPSGVGDVGQLPPLEIGANPWRGDPGYNPYRAWPTDYDDDDAHWSARAPGGVAPAAEQLPLWRAFYPEWGELDCVAAPGDRSLDASGSTGVAAAVWDEVATGCPGAARGRRTARKPRPPTSTCR